MDCSPYGATAGLPAKRKPFGFLFQGTPCPAEHFQRMPVIAMIVLFSQVSRIQPGWVTLGALPRDPARGMIPLDPSFAAALGLE